MMTLYHYPYSQHARRVVSLLEAAGLPYRLHPVDMGKQEYLTDEYAAINPNRQIPTLIDGTVIIHESNAILRYLCAKHGLDDWYPADLARRAAVEQWLDWNQCRLGPAVVDIVLNTVFMGEDGDKAAIARGHEKLTALARILDDALAAQDYLAGDTPTIADLSVASNIFHLGFADALPDRPNIRAWFARMSAIEGFRKSLPEKQAA